MKNAKAFYSIVFIGAINLGCPYANAETDGIPQSGVAKGTRHATSLNAPVTFKNKAVTQPNTASKSMPAEPLSDMSETQAMRMQQQMDRQSKADAAASNMLKKESDTRSTTTSNMK